MHKNLMQEKVMAVKRVCNLCAGVCSQDTEAHSVRAYASEAGKGDGSETCL